MLPKATELIEAKNDNCHVEQENWSVVRYDRLDFPELVPMMNDRYANELYL